MASLSLVSLVFLCSVARIAQWVDQIPSSPPPVCAAEVLSTTPPPPPRHSATPEIWPSSVGRLTPTKIFSLETLHQLGLSGKEITVRPTPPSLL